jgi:hypothetical protein
MPTVISVACFLLVASTRFPGLVSFCFPSDDPLRPSILGIRPMRHGAPCRIAELWTLKESIGGISVPDVS